MNKIATITKEQIDAAAQALPPHDEKEDWKIWFARQIVLTAKDGQCENLTLNGLLLVLAIPMNDGRVEIFDPRNSGEKAWWLPNNLVDPNIEAVCKGYFDYFVTRFEL